MREIDGKRPPEPWILRPATVRGLRYAGLGLLVVLVAASFVVEKQPYFDLDAIPAFGAWFGAAAAAGLIVVAKLLGALLRRWEGSYDD